MVSGMQFVKALAMPSRKGAVRSVEAHIELAFSSGARQSRGWYPPIRLSDCHAACVMPRVLLGRASGVLPMRALFGPSVCQGGQNRVGSFGDAHSWQHMGVIAQRWIDLEQAIVFRHCLGKIVPSNA